MFVPLRRHPVELSRRSALVVVVVVVSGVLVAVVVFLCPSFSCGVTVHLRRLGRSRPHILAPGDNHRNVDRVAPPSRGYPPGHGPSPPLPLLARRRRLGSTPAQTLPR